MEALVDDLQQLRSRVEVTLGTGVRKITELLELRIENVNFRGLSIFRPQTGAMSKSGLTGFSWWTPRAKARHGVMPMNGQVRAALLEVIQDRKSGRVIDDAHTGVSESTLRRGFRKACKRAGIPIGQNVEGGLIWHDLRCTTTSLICWAIPPKALPERMRAAHRKLLEEAVNKLTEPRGAVLKFERNAS